MKRMYAVLGLCILLITNSFAQTTEIDVRKVSKISVTGTAELKIEPDEIYMTFSLKEYSNKSKEKIDIESITREFLAACSKAGIANEDISVHQAGGNAYNQWWIKKNKQKPEFRATISYEIKFSDTKKIDILMPMLNDKAVSNAYISRVDHSKMEELKKEVKIKAMKSAKDKAMYLASSIGETVGKALLIEELEYGDTRFANYRMQSNVMMTRDTGAAGNQDIAFKKITIKQQVRIAFKLQ